MKRLMYVVLLSTAMGSLYAENLSTAAASEPELHSYPDRGSIKLGETLNIHISGSMPTVTVKVSAIHYARRWTVIEDELSISLQPIPDQPWRTDQRWPVSTSFLIPTDWNPGLYEFRVISNEDPSVWDTFSVSVQPVELGSFSKIAVLGNDSTTMAYNEFGGKSNYKSHLGDLRANIMSVNKPGNFKLSHRDYYFPKWAANAGIDVEYISSMDLHYEEKILDAYEVLVLHGHSEYWSREMRDELERFLAAGGKLISLSGNTMWWAIRYVDSPEGVLMVSCKGWRNDELCSQEPNEVTKHWHDIETETKLFGASWQYGGYIDSHGFYTRAEGYGGYFVRNADHWFWQGTGVLDGFQVGQASGIAGYEADAPPLKIENNQLVIDTARDEVPAGIEVLGTSPAATSDREGFGAIVYFPYGENGGEVFNCGSTDCAMGLRYDRAWTKAILNVFVKFGAIETVLTDMDGDGIDDCNDNCIYANPDQLDITGDGTGDECDQGCH